MLGKLIRYFASMAPMGLHFRARLYRLSGVQVGRGAAIDRNVQLTYPGDISIGDRVTIAAGVSLLAETTALNSRLESDYGIRKAAPVVIEDDAWIGVKATILPGVTVGSMATVGANSLVLQDVPPRAVVIGVPARVIFVRPSRDSEALPGLSPDDSEHS